MSGIQSHLLQLLLITSIATGASIAHAAKLYKWADEAGQIHYSEIPPTDRTTEEVNSDTEAVSAPLESPPVEIPQSTNPQASQQLADKCQGLYRDLELYISRQPITDSEGNAMVVSEEMREAKITEIKAELDQSCR